MFSKHTYSELRLSCLHCWSWWFTNMGDRFRRPRAILNRLVRAKPPQYGWYQQLELVSETNYTGTVTLQGGIVGNTFPLWFGTFPQSEALINAISVKALDMNVSHHFGDDKQWGIVSI